MTALTTERVATGHGRDVLVVHIDDGKANALSLSLLTELHGLVDMVESDETVGALVLHGRPGMFSAGFDLSVVKGGDVDAGARLLGAGADLFRRLYGAPTPVVAACTGHAVAGGAFMLLSSDLRVGADVACRIGLNEVAIGFVLPAWAITLSEERLSVRHRQRAVMLAELTGPAEAVEAGFLDIVVPADEVLPLAVSRASEYAAFTRAAYAGNVIAARGRVLELLAEQVRRDRDRGEGVADYLAR